jgi:thioredoxin 1
MENFIKSYGRDRIFWIKAINNNVILLLFVMLLLFHVNIVHGSERTSDFNQLPIKGVVTLIDLGAKKCIPCKMMAPILEKIEKAYQGKAAIVFIDVWKNKKQAGRFGIRAIPTQIFYDTEGKEVYRHVGFLSEEAIVAQFKKMGVD